jgi:Ca-activated chloride channel family protein
LESPSGDFSATQPGNSFPGVATCLGLERTGNLFGDSGIPTPDALGIAKLWARRKIESITDSLIEGVDAQTVRAAVVALGLEHHLVTQYTSLVAVDVTPTSPVGGGETRNVPANVPHGSTATLPRTATPATLYALIALVLLAAALMLRPREAISDER